MTRSFTRIVAALQACVFTVVCAAAPAVSEEQNFAQPGEIVEQLHGQLIDIMKNADDLGFHGRYIELEPTIAANFDTPLIAKVILSRYWDELDTEQKESFIQLFLQLSIATYASRFKDYDGERFIEVAKEPLNKGRLLIKTEMVRPGDKPVQLDYLMHENSGKWMIISVIANGVNDLSLKRAEYAAVIKDKGYDALVEEIRTKITEMEKEASG